MSVERFPSDRRLAQRTAIILLEPALHTPHVEHVLIRAGQTHHLFIALELRQAHTTLSTARLRIATLELGLGKTLNQVGSRARPAWLVHLSIVIAEARDSDDCAHRDHATFAEGHIADENHESQRTGGPWVDAGRMQFRDDSALLPISVVQNVAPNIPRRVDGQNDNCEQDEPQVLSASLLHLHELIHADYQVKNVDQHRTQQPQLEVAALRLIIVNDKVDRLVGDDADASGNLEKLVAL